MPNSNEQERLLAKLQEHEALRARGYEFSSMNGVLVKRAGHARGIWRCRLHGFSWTPAGYNEPVHCVEDAEAAVRYTLDLFAAS